MTRSRDEPAARPSATDVVDDSRRLAERLGAGRYDRVRRPPDADSKDATHRGNRTKGKVSVIDTAEWNLFVGDESLLPAAFAMAESREDPIPKLLVLEVGSTADEQPAVLGVPGHSLQFVHRGGASAGGSMLLADELRTTALPSGVGHAYVGGELQVVAGIRSVLLERGLAPEQISSKACWRANTPNANHGEPPRDR